MLVHETIRLKELFHHFDVCIETKEFHDLIILMQLILH